MDDILVFTQNMLPREHEAFYTVGYFLKSRTNFDLEDKLLPVYNMASPGLKKMLGFLILYTHKSVSENECPVFLFFEHQKQMMCHMLGIWNA